MPNLNHLKRKHLTPVAFFPKVQYCTQHQTVDEEYDSTGHMGSAAVRLNEAKDRDQLHSVRSALPQAPKLIHNLHSYWTD